jgi:tRNA(adenine34) deaminase
MCGGAAYWTQLKKVVYGASDEKRGFSRLSKNILHPKTEVITGVQDVICGEILTQFFEKKRD